MIKNIVIGVLVILLAFFVTYSFIKAKEAEKNAAEALAQKALAEKHLMIAQEAEQNAVEHAAMAQVEVKKAKEALADCQGR